MTIFVSSNVAYSDDAAAGSFFLKGLKLKCKSFQVPDFTLRKAYQFALSREYPTIIDIVDSKVFEVAPDGTEDFEIPALELRIGTPYVLNDLVECPNSKILSDLFLIDGTELKRVIHDDEDGTISKLNEISLNFIKLKAGEVNLRQRIESSTNSTDGINQHINSIDLRSKIAATVSALSLIKSVI